MGPVTHSIPTHPGAPEVSTDSPGASGTADGAAHAPIAQAVQPLAGVPLDEPEAVAGGDEKEFGAAAEDFYPTELRARPVGKAVVPSDGGDAAKGRCRP